MFLHQNRYPSSTFDENPCRFLSIFKLCFARSTFYVNNFSLSLLLPLLFQKLERESLFFENTTAGEEQQEPRSSCKSLQVTAVDLARVARPPARTHERNETISRLGPLRSHPPNLRQNNYKTTTKHLQKTTKTTKKTTKQLQQTTKQLQTNYKNTTQNYNKL